MPYLPFEALDAIINEHIDGRGAVAGRVGLPDKRDDAVVEAMNGRAIAAVYVDAWVPCRRI